MKLNKANDENLISVAYLSDPSKAAKAPANVNMDNPLLNQDKSSQCDCGSNNVTTAEGICHCTDCGKDFTAWTEPEQKSIASTNQTVKMSKQQWVTMGKKAGWLTEAMEDPSYYDPEPDDEDDVCEDCYPKKCDCGREPADDVPDFDKEFGGND